MAATAPFTNLVIYADSKNNQEEKKDRAAAWILQEVSKNPDLPQLPFEMWCHIVAFTVQEKRKDLIIIGDYILMTFLAGTQLAPQSAAGPGQHVQLITLNHFIKKHGPDTVESIHQTSLATKMEEHLMQREIFCGRMTIQMAIACA
jgi:hypothetical protein